ncbi:hypothetical protein [Halochromatium roseum]|uniref:hypothetical protein n=1 Tax=Halochromatium roseum TaxID=391920 RepID=UPI0019126F27|nr:hypothetical protein [Halochromatium roseum]MBK5937695.1 hypothetical protein [Halochromatium roseum]
MKVLFDMQVMPVLGLHWGQQDQQGLDAGARVFSNLAVAAGRARGSLRVVLLGFGCTSSARLLLGAGGRWRLARVLVGAPDRPADAADFGLVPVVWLGLP